MKLTMWRVVVVLNMHTKFLFRKDEADYFSRNFVCILSPRASPTYIKGNENECYAGSQIYESKSCILLINKALLPSDVRNHAMLSAWRLLAGKCYYCFLSCVHKVTIMSEVTNISVYCHRNIPAIQQSLMWA